jgi:hypothetical protein
MQETGRFSGSYPAIPFELGSKNQAEAVVVVPVVRVVVVAIGNTAVPGVVVPATAAENAVRAPKPVSFNLKFFALI